MGDEIMNDSFLLLVVLYFFATQEHVLFYDKEKMYFKINFKKCEARKISTLKNCTSDHKCSSTDCSYFPFCHSCQGAQNLILLPEIPEIISCPRIDIISFPLAFSSV